MTTQLLVLDTPALTAARAELTAARAALSTAGAAWDAARQRPDGKRRAVAALSRQVEDLEVQRDVARNLVERALRAANPGLTEARLNNVLREL